MGDTIGFFDASLRNKLLAKLYQITTNNNKKNIYSDILGPELSKTITQIVFNRKNFHTKVLKYQILLDRNEDSTRSKHLRLGVMLLVINKFGNDSLALLHKTFSSVITLSEEPEVKINAKKLTVLKNLKN